MIFNIAKTLLLEIDVQNDFCPAYTSGGVHYPDGALAVHDGGSVVAPLNALAGAFAASGGKVVLTQDWHPARHSSFASGHEGKTSDAEGQVFWPDHCVQGLQGAAFHADLDLNPATLIIRKGFHKELDSYSAFFENDRKTFTGLDYWMRGLGIETVIIGGLATDYCVFYSAMDSVSLGYTTIVASDAVRGVGYPSGSVEKAVATMKNVGIAFVTSPELLNGLQ